MSTCTIIIPTLNAAKDLQANLAVIKSFEPKIPVLIVDSESTDQTVVIAQDLGAEVLPIKRTCFNHGATREQARKTVSTKFVVMMTQDALPVNEDFLARLLAPLIQDDKVAVSYARQLPNDGAKVLEAFPRQYNYAEDNQIRSLEDIAHYGVYTFFCSNSCAAYRNSALNEIGGFKPVLTNEDYFAVAALLQKGHNIAYAADSLVKHSHCYSLKQEFQRYFDTGYVRAENPIIQDLVGQAEARGVGFASSLLKKILREQPRLLPYVILQCGVKFLGYRVGFYGRYLPDWLKIKLSMQSYYWKSTYYQSTKSSVEANS